LPPTSDVLSPPPPGAGARATPPRFRICFAGTAGFACPALEALLAAGRDEIALVLTQPDRPAGRGRVPTPSPVKALALAHGLPLYQPERLKPEDEALAPLRACAPDVLVVAAYGLLLPPALLALPRLPPLNLHGSLLPRWRGAAPVERAILAGDSETGIALMRIVSALDAGPVLLTARLPLSGTETGGEVRERLAHLGAALLLEGLAALERGPLPESPQDETQVTYAAKIQKTDLQLDWAQAARELARRVRAFAPRPGVWARLPGGECKVLAARAEEDPGIAATTTAPAATAAAPGTVLAAGAEGIAVATGAGVLWLLTLQAPGKRPVAAREFLAGQARWLEPAA
jgi:methionyl-tRNA formyltransferase